MQCKQRDTMNAKIKHQLDERLIEGAMTPDEYLAEVRAHCEQAADPDVDDKHHAPQRLKRGLKSWQWRVLIPVTLIFSATLAEPVARPTGYVAPGGGQPEVTGGDQLVVTPETKPKTLREYYEPPAKQTDIFSMPDPQRMPSGSYSGQAGPPQISPEDAYALGIVLAPFVQLQQEMLAQQQDAALQKYQAQQVQRQQAEQRIQENGRRFAGLMQQSPVQPRQSSPPAWSPQPAPSANPSQVACQYECPHCHRVQTYAFRLAIPPICTQDSHTMNLRR